MKRKIIGFSLVILSINLFSQDIILEKEITLKSVFKDKRETLPIINNEKQDISLFLLDNSEIKGLKINTSHALTDSFTTEKPDKKYKELLGHSTNNEGNHLFFTNEKKKEFYVKTISISNKKGTGKPVPLKLKKEKFLETISYKNKFYLLSIIKKTSRIKIYVFEGNSLARTEQLDFSEYQFSNTGYTSLYGILLDESNTPVQLNLKIHKIDNSNPNPLDLTTKENKLYYNDNKIVITLDNNLENTKVITISLEDFSSKVEFYDQITIESKNSNRVKSNSYLFSDHLYQIKGSKEKLCFRILDIENGFIIKTYCVKENENIDFRNTPLIQEGGTVFFMQDSEKELTKTKQVLRKIAAGDIGITAMLSGNNVELTIGGYKEVTRSGGAPGMMMNSPGMMMSSPGIAVSIPNGTVTPSLTYHYNPTMYGYNTYTDTRAVYFKSLFDRAGFNHVSGEVSESVYDKIKNYEEDNDEGMSSETIFKVDDYYVFGYYKKWDKKYYLVKFECD